MDNLKLDLGCRSVEDASALRAHAIRAGIETLRSSGELRFPITGTSLGSLADSLSDSPDACSGVLVGIGVATPFGPSLGPPIDTLGMYLDAVLLARALGLPSVHVVFFERGARRSFAPEQRPLFRQRTKEQMRIARRFTAGVSDVSFNLVRDDEIARMPEYAAAFRQQKQCRAQRGLSRYARLQNMTFAAYAAASKARVKLGWSIVDDEAAITLAKVHERFAADAFQGADESCFDALTREAFPDRLWFAYRRPALAFSSGSPIVCPYSTKQLVSHGKLLPKPGSEMRHGRILLYRDVPMDSMLPDLDAPQGKDNDSRRRWIDAMIAAGDSILHLLHRVALLHPGFPEVQIPGEIIKVDSRIATLECEVAGKSRGRKYAADKFALLLARAERMKLLLRAATPVLRELVRAYGVRCAA